MAIAMLARTGQKKLLLDPSEIEEAIRAEGPVNFRFTYKGMGFSACYADSADGAWLSMVGTVGILPYTAQSFSARRNVLAVVAAANATLGKLFRINAASRIEVRGAVRMGHPANAANLITAAAQILMPTLPYIECIADAGGRLRTNPQISASAR